MKIIERLKRGLLKLKSNIGSDRIKKVGKVKFLNRTKGYGFIKSKETAKDVFMHFSDTEDNLSAGDKVKFYVTREQKGLRATQIELA